MQIVFLLLFFVHFIYICLLAYYLLIFPFYFIFYLTNVQIIKHKQSFFTLQQVFKRLSDEPLWPKLITWSTPEKKFIFK